VLTLGTTGAISVAVAPQDGRKGIDGRAGVVTAALGKDPASGDPFVFKNRRGDWLKILAWQGDGFALDLRRLERGTFAFPAADGAELAVTPAQLAMILGGLDPSDCRRRKRYARPSDPPEPRRAPGRTGGMADDAPDPHDAEIARLRSTVGELLGVVADLRGQVESQQARIDQLVKLAFGPRGERAAGPIRPDDAPADAEVAPSPPPGGPRDAPAARRGHGRRARPADLQRERVEVDLTDAEKVCLCRAPPRVRVGLEVSERLDYRPASLFVREIARPTYGCVNASPVAGTNAPYTYPLPRLP